MSQVDPMSCNDYDPGDAVGEARVEGHQSDERPIGVFDTGLGGIGVVKRIHARLPRESVLFLSDRARMPYGDKPLLEAKQYVAEAVAYLLRRSVKAVIIACNTATVLGLEDATKAHPHLPILGVVEPAIAQAAQATRNKRVGLLGSERTVLSQAHTRRLRALDPEIQVFGQATPLLAALVQTGELSGEHAQQLVAMYLHPLRALEVDTLILACTHYPFLAPLIQEYMGPDVTLIDPADEAVHQLERLMDQGRVLPSTPCTEEAARVADEFCTTQHTQEMMTVGTLLLGRPIGSVHTVLIDELAQ